MHVVGRPGQVAAWGEWPLAVLLPLDKPFGDCNYVCLLSSEVKNALNVALSEKELFEPQIVMVPCLEVPV